MAKNPLTKIVQTAFNDACRDFTAAMKERGFSRTKTRLWIRLNEQTIDVLSLYREGSSYGAPIGGSLDIRINSSVRIPTDTTDYLALNGPQSDVARTRAGKYHLRFNAKSRHMYHRCLADLIRFVDCECESWFVEMRRPTKQRKGGLDSTPSDETRKLLGLKHLPDTQTNGT